MLCAKFLACDGFSCFAQWTVMVENQITKTKNWQTTRRINIQIFYNIIIIIIIM
jgi:hypothetical protein